MFKTAIACAAFVTLFPVFGCVGDLAPREGSGTPESVAPAPPPVVNGQAKLTMTPEAAAVAGSTYDFGDGVIGGKASPSRFVLRNDGAVALHFAPSAVLVTGAAGGDFLIANKLPLTTLDPGQTTTITVAFLPTAEGTRGASLVASPLEGGPSATLALHGNGRCPTTPPVDLDAPGLRSACTVELLVATDARASRVVSADSGMTWKNFTIDDTNCLSNADGTLNCGDRCNGLKRADCRSVAGGLDCTRADPNDATKTICGGFDDSAFGAAFGLGLIVVAADFGIHTSADAGKTWKKAPPPAPQQWGGGLHVAASSFGNGFFLVASGGTTFKSMDGYKWTRSDDTMGGGYYGFGGFAFGNGHFVAAGGGRKVTTDGTNWTNVGSDGANGNVAFGNGVFIAVGDHGLRMSSADGMTWTKVGADVCSNAAGWLGDPNACLGNLGPTAFGNGKFLTCGTHFATSLDGKSWTSLQSWTYRHVSFAGGEFWQDEGSRSVDGQKWSKTGAAVNGVVSGGRVLKASIQ